MINAACSSCGRKFTFQPDSVRETCQICGGKVALPAGFKPPPRANAPLTVACPICARPKELDAALAAQTHPCWFCQADLAIPRTSGVAALAIPDDAPADRAREIPAPPDDASPASQVVWDLVQHLRRAGRLGARAAEWIPQQLQRLHDWEAAGPFDCLPLEPRFAAVVVSVGVFRAHHTVEQPLENGGLRVSFQLEQASTTGTGLTVTTVLANIVGVTALFATGRGFVVTPGNEDDEPPPSRWLDIDLWTTARGTEIGYAVRGFGSEAAVLRSLRSREFRDFFPGAFVRGALGILGLKAAYGATAPGRLFGYVTRDALRAQVERLTGDAGFAATAAERFFRHLKD